MKPPCSATNLQQLNSQTNHHTNITKSGTSTSTSNTNSIGITYSQQDQLPLLPIPDLHITLQRLEQRVVALLPSKEQQQQTQHDINEFLNTDGPILYQELCNYEKIGRTTGIIGSYVEEFWNESYLQPDTSVVLNLNPFFVLEDSPDPKMVHDQMKRAAGLCYASIHMVSLIKLELLKPDSFRNQPLCMHQYKSLFASSRQPTLNQNDDVHVFNDSTHVVVMYKNQFYYFFALWADTLSVAVNESDILDILLAIQTHATSASNNDNNDDGLSLGVFTSLPRSQWAVIRQEICTIESNQTAIRMIDSALFILVLDDYIPPNIHTAAANMLHGMNVYDTSTKKQIGTCLNRWYDKLQLIVCADGTSGLIFEHSIIDGHSALRFVSDIYSETVIHFAESIIDLIHGRGQITHVVNAVVERAVIVNKAKSERYLDIRPKKLIFDVSESIINQIRFAEAALCDEIHSTDTIVLEYKQFGKRLIVANNMSPDAFVQMSILLAYYKLYGKVECMYEPAMTKHFFHGRTEGIRGTTVQAKDFCEVWCNTKATTNEKLNALRKATTEHSRLTKEAASGQGVDRLLFALKCIATRISKDGTIPPFFHSTSWTTLNHTVISTSNCGNPALRLFGFGPVVPNGFGIGYIIKDDAISYSVCSKRRQTSRYVQTLEQFLNDIQDLFQPISTVSVDHQQDNGNESASKKTEAEITSSYHDIWGESDPNFTARPTSEIIQDNSINASTSSLLPPRFREQSIRGDLLSVSNSAIDI